MQHFFELIAIVSEQIELSASWITSLPRDMDFAEAYTRLEQWLRDQYARQPIVIVALIGVLVLPVLTLFAWSARRIAKPRKTDSIPATVHHIPERAVMTTWLEFAPELSEDTSTVSALKTEMFRIGRDAENDLSINHQTVHRFPRGDQS